MNRKKKSKERETANERERVRETDNQIEIAMGKQKIKNHKKRWKRINMGKMKNNARLK